MSLNGPSSVPQVHMHSFLLSHIELIQFTVFCVHRLCRRGAVADQRTMEDHAPLIEPLVMDFMVVTFDRRPGMELPVLTAEATKAGGRLDKEKVMKVLNQIGNAASCRQPFTIMWDARYLKAMQIRRSHVNAAIEWAKDKTVAKLLDEHVQGVVVVLNSRILRAITYFLFKMLQPPQPTQVFTNQQAALAFLSERCQSVKAWTPLEERLAAVALADQHIGLPTADDTMEQERDELVAPVAPSSSGGVQTAATTVDRAPTLSTGNGSALHGALSATLPEQQQPTFSSGSIALNLLVPVAAAALGFWLDSPLAGLTFLLGLSSSTATSWRC